MFVAVLFGIVQRIAIASPPLQHTAGRDDGRLVVIASLTFALMSAVRREVLP